MKEAIPLEEVVASATEIAPTAETETGEVPETATVPEASGMVIVLVPVGAVKLRVVLLAPEVLMIEVPM